jgi:hypothetical protein
MAKTRQDLKDKENTTEIEVPKTPREDIFDICSEIDIVLFEEALKEEGEKESLKRKREPETKDEPERKIPRNGYSNDYYRSEPRNNRNYEPRRYDRPRYQPHNREDAKDTLDATRAITIALATIMEQASTLRQCEGRDCTRAYTILRKTAQLYADFTSERLK